MVWLTVTKPKYKDLWTPDSDSSAADIDTYNEKMKELFELLFKKSSEPIPGKPHVEVGLFVYEKGEILNLQLGFSHDATYKIPKGIKLTVEKSTIIKINGIDKELVGKVASEIKNVKTSRAIQG